MRNFSPREVAHARLGLLITRYVLLAVTAGMVVALSIGYARAEDLLSSEVEWLTLGPAGVFGAIGGLHLAQRYRGRKVRIVGGRTWLDIVGFLVLGSGVGLGVAVLGYNLGGDRGDFLFNAGMGIWVISLLASPLGLVLLLSFVDAPMQLARTMGNRAGWYLLMVMVAVYLLAIALAMYENADDPPALFSLPGAAIYATVIGIGLVLIVEQSKRQPPK